MPLKTKEGRKRKPQQVHNLFIWTTRYSFYILITHWTIYPTAYEQLSTYKEMKETGKLDNKTRSREQLTMLTHATVFLLVAHKTISPSTCPNASIHFLPKSQ